MNKESTLTNEELYKIGINHRGVVITFSIGFLIHFAVGMQQGMQQGNAAVLRLADILSIACWIFLNIFAWKMITGMKKNPVPFLVIMIATLIFAVFGYPVAGIVSLVMFAIYHDKAIKILKTAGVKVSLLGATSSALKELKK